MEDFTEDIQDLVEIDPQRQLTFTVRSKSTYYNHAIRVYIPHSPYEKLYEGKHHTVIPPNAGREPTDEERVKNLERSVNRTKKKIRNLALSNRFSIFATFTFSTDRQDIDKCKSKMHNWLKNYQKRNAKLKYILVPEFHKDGKALHFHALIDGFEGNLKPGINAKTGKPIKQKGRQVYSIPSFRSGFTNVKIIDDDNSSHTKLNAYLQKYITKDMPIFSDKKRYWASKGLELPYIEYNTEQWYRHLKPTWIYEDDFGILLEFPIEDCPDIERAKGVFYRE